MYTATRQQMARLAFSLLAAVFSNSAFADYVANQIDYIDPVSGSVANYTQLLARNQSGADWFVCSGGWKSRR